MRRLVFLLPALLLLIGAGCGSHDHPVTPPPADPHAGHHMPTGLQDAVPAGNRIAVLTEIADVAKARQLRFRLSAADGRELGPEELQVAHEKLMHLLVVRDDYQEFHHVHPAYLNGAWEAYVPFESGGAYQAYVDIVPTQGAAVTLRQELKVGDGRTRSWPLVPTKLQTAGKFEAELTTTEEDGGITYAFALRKDGASVTDISPYLGAYGHVVMLRKGDPDGFIHMHPVTDAAPTDGIVRFRSDAPGPGTYALFGQFAPEDDLRIFPFVIEIGG